MKRRPPGSVAPLLERLAVLLEAGVSPAAAWGHLAGATAHPRDARIAREVGGAVARGSPGAEALVAAVTDFGGGSHSVAPGYARDDAHDDARAGAVGPVSEGEWRQVAAAWSVAETCGSPLAPCLRASADAARSVSQARRDTAVALSGPVSTSRIVLALPGVGLLMGLALGFDTLGVLVTHPVGWFCSASALGLVLLARLWNRRLVRRATPPDVVPGLDLELLATALGGGGSWPDARSRVTQALKDFCGDTFDECPASEIDVLVELSERAGVPAAALLRSAADERRRDARAAAAMAAERLGVALMLPLGVCILPAFLLIGVVPLFVALLSSTSTA